MHGIYVVELDACIQTYNIYNYLVVFFTHTLCANSRRAYNGFPSSTMTMEMMINYWLVSSIKWCVPLFVCCLLRNSTATENNHFRSG